MAKVQAQIETIIDYLVDTTLAVIVSGDNYYTTPTIISRVVEPPDMVEDHPALFVMRGNNVLTEQYTNASDGAEYTVEEKLVAIIGYNSDRENHDTDIHKLMIDVKKAMRVDKTLNSNAINTILVGDELKEFTDIENTLKNSMALIYNIRYEEKPN